MSSRSTHGENRRVSRNDGKPEGRSPSDTRLSCLCVSGQRTLQHSGDVLDTQVVVNPGSEFVSSEVSQT